MPLEEPSDPDASIAPQAGDIVLSKSASHHIPTLTDAPSIQ
jgi:hypothetical protein